jgi:TonB-dependent SusC/RagA subfamily outer membrane receptor
MIKIFILTLTILIVVNPIVQSQTNNQNQAANKPKTKLDIPFEKVYLHLDKPYYSAGEDIWFKAYLVNAETNELFDNSNNLYVELISPQSKIIQKRILRIDKGLGNGDFHLEDSIPSGNYQIRAYTNWMRNFGDMFFFKKEITIESPIGIKRTVPADEKKTKAGIDVQFFPEGGALIQDVYSRIGFKAINSTGLGCNIKGVVYSSAGDSITNFSSTHLGMGNFNFLAKRGLDYFAEGFADNGASFKVTLPSALETGYLLKVSDGNSNNIHISIKTNQKTLEQFPLRKLLIVGSSHNALCAAAKIISKTMVQSVVFPKKLFPEGICRISVMDTFGIYLCERIYYNHTKESCHINILTNKSTYTPREKVTIQISLKDTANKPVPASLSLSVIDGRQIPGFDKKSNINSYLFLESEIRGNIEQPYYYFDTTNVDRFKELNNLLLTQGWRNIIWKHLSDTTINLDNLIEKGLTISGRLRRLLVNKPIADANISMGLFGTGTLCSSICKTDSSGKYYFDGLNFTGTHQAVISATNKNHRSQGWISLDSIFKDMAPPKFNEFQQTENPVDEVKSYTVESEKKYNILKKYHLTDTIMLNEVLVKSKKIEKKEGDGHFRMYSSPDCSITVTDQMLSYSDVFQLLQGRVAGLMISGVYPNISFTMRGSHGIPLFLIDNFPVELDEIASIPISTIDKVEVLKDPINTSLYGSRGGNGVISIYTKNGFVSSAKPVFHSINQKITGYYQSKTFYSPKYDTTPPDNNKPDLRSTIYWEPNLVTDSAGNASVSFYNADNSAPIKITIEGISDSGTPITGNSSYNVQ